MAFIVMVSLEIFWIYSNEKKNDIELRGHHFNRS